MLVIRFRRVGKKSKPTYRVVVAEHTWAPNGKFTDDLGSYNPHTKANTLNKERTLEWLQKGAQPSNSVAKLLEKEKVKHASVVVIKKNRPAKSSAAAEAEPTPPQTDAADASAEAPPASPDSETTTEPIDEEPAEEAAA